MILLSIVLVGLGIHIHGNRTGMSLGAQYVLAMICGVVMTMIYVKFGVVK